VATEHHGAINVLGRAAEENQITTAPFLSIYDKPLSFAGVPFVSAVEPGIRFIQKITVQLRLKL
jgi:hypothetical protein